MSYSTVWLTHLSFWKQSIAPWERPSVLNQWLSSHSSLLSNGTYGWPSSACLLSFSHKVSWWPSRGFPVSVSTFTFKWGVGGDPPLSLMLASDSKLHSGLREGPKSSSSQFQSPSEPCPVSGGASWRWFGIRVEPWEVPGCVRLWLLHFVWQIRLHWMWFAKLPWCLTFW